MVPRLRRRLALTVIILLVTVFPSGARSADGVSADELRASIARLQHIPGEELPRAELEIEPGARIPWWISREDAIEDAERFFYLLSHGWCGYEYFRTEGKQPDAGGDPFHEAERAVLSRLRAKERWSPDGLAELIHEQLGFVRDCHLNLNDESFCRHPDFWFDPRLDLSEGEGTFRFTLEGASYLLLEVNGESPEGYLFRSINAAGKAVHLLGALSSEEPSPLVVTAGSALGEVRLQRPLSRSDFRSRKRFAEERIGGIPVVRMRSFADYFGRELQAIVDRAETYRGEPYVILDIRGNGGGNTAWPRQWIASFTGRIPSLKQALTELVNRTTMTGRANIFALSMNTYRKQERAAIESDFERFRVEAETFDDPTVSPYWSEPYLPAAEPIPNETTLIVIMDRHVASAGEGLVSYLHDQVENVVLVGENTLGALTFGQQSAHRLPHSKLLAYLPIKLNVPLDLEVREELGFTPDFWVPAQHALNHAVAAARAGTIATRVPLPDGYFAPAFVPERPPPWWYLPRRDRAPAWFLLALGVILAVVNRKRGRAMFFVAGGVALALCAGYLYFGSHAGYVLGLVGCAYFAIGLAKGKNKASWRSPAAP